MLYWGDKPFARMILVFAIGIILGRYFPVYHSCIYIILGIILISLIISTWYKGKNREYIAGAILLLLSLSGGYVRYVNMHPLMQPSHYQHQLITKSNWVEVEVKSIPKLTSRYSCSVEVRALGSQQDRMSRQTGLIMAYFQKEDTIVQSYRPGDQIFLRGYVTKLRRSRNPNAFDFNDYLRTKHIYYRIDVEPNLHIATGVNLSHPLAKLANCIREHSLHTFEKYYDNTDHQSLFGAMVLGYRNTIDPKLYESYTKTGAVHVLAVSGLHVGILSTIIFFFLNRIFKSNTNRNKVIKLVTIAICCAIYVLITGATAAVMRASVMIVIYYIGKYWAEHVDSYNVIAMSGFILLAYDPYMLFQASFQFSFLALLSIIYFYPKIYDLLYIENKYLNYLWQLIVLSLAAQVLVSPLTIYYFHRFPTVFALSGLIAVPAATIILIGGISMVLIEYVLPLFNEYISMVYTYIMELFIGSIRLIEGIPGSTIENLWIYHHELALTYIFILCMMAAYSWKSSNMVIVGLVSLLSYVGSRSCYELKAQHQAGITIYDIFNGYMIDFYAGSDVYFLRSENVNDRTIAFITTNHRIKHKLNNTQEISLQDTISETRLAKNGNLIQLGTESILLIDSSYHLTQSQIKVDLAIVLNKCGHTPEEIMNHIDAERWVITQNEKYYRQLDWEERCGSMQQECIIIREQGSYRYQLE